MRDIRWNRASLIAIVLLCFAMLSGCIVAPAQPGYYGEQVVAVAPPPPREEVIGIAPAAGYFWIGGYWGWAGGRHEWVAGHWEAPRNGQRWVPHEWRHEEHGWRQHPGHWESGERR